MPAETARCWARGKAVITTSGSVEFVALGYGDSAQYEVTHAAYSFLWSDIIFSGADLAGCRAVVHTKTATTFTIDIYRYDVGEGPYTAGPANVDLDWVRIGGSSRDPE